MLSYNEIYVLGALTGIVIGIGFTLSCQWLARKLRDTHVNAR